jgi:hypothetical protein
MLKYDLNCQDTFVWAQQYSFYSLDWFCGVCRISSMQVDFGVNLAPSK